MANKQVASINLVHSIVCDDIRREDNGKFFLIGVYPEVIMLSAIPAQIVLGLWLQCRVQVFTKTTLEFQIRGNALQATLPFSLEIGDENVFGKIQNIPLIVKLLFSFVAEGEFTIYYRPKGAPEWQIAQSMGITRNAPGPGQVMQ